MVATRPHWIGIVLISTSVACSFQGLPIQNDGDGGVLFEDAPAADAYIPDAGACATTGPTCAGPVLRTCITTGQLPTDTTCNWGCRSELGAPHCGRLQPSGGFVTLADLDDNPLLLDKSATSNSGTIDTETGAISANLRGAGTGIINGIDFAVRTLPTGEKAGVFRAKKLTLQGTWLVKGKNALVIVATTDIQITGRLDVRGECKGREAGPGGFDGGDHDQAGKGFADPGGAITGGSAGSSSGANHNGGAGGGYGDLGGDGGAANGRATGGGKAGTATIPVLVGGGGGGGGGGGKAGTGGGGGGAVQLVANGKITVESLFSIPFQASGINAGGCGGDGGEDSGGGGGAGGTILLEARTVVIDASVLAVNGGGGGGGGGTGPGVGRPGEAGLLGNNVAAGGQAGQGGSSGGRGGASGNRTGGRGGDSKNSGGGGGGVGRIRINTLDGQGIQIKNQNFVVISPSFNEGNTTSTKGPANIQ